MSTPSKPKKRFRNPYVVRIDDRLLDFSGRIEDFEKLVEAAKILAPIIEEKGWETVKEEYFQELKRIEEETGEPVTDPDYFRIHHAQRRRSELIDKGLTEEEALNKLAYEMGESIEKVRDLIQGKPISRLDGRKNSMSQ